MNRIFSIFCAAGVSCSLMSVAPVSAQSVSDFYRNQTLRIIVPTGSGGDRALYTLLFANYFSQHIPGKPKVLPVFMPGAGGSVGLNYTYNVAKPDGLTIVTPLTSVLSAQLTADKSVKYDASKFKWIGRTADATRILFVTTKSHLDDWTQLKNRQVIVGSDGEASETYRNAAFMNNVFGTRFKIITGYASAGAMNMAVESGETQGSFTTWDDLHSYHPDWIRDGKVKVLLQIGLNKNPDLQKAPLLLDLAKSEQTKKLVELMSSAAVMGQSFAAPPGFPDYLVKALRTAFDEVMKDPQFQARARAAKMHINPMSGKDLNNTVANIMSSPPELMKQFRASVQLAKN